MLAGMIRTAARPPGWARLALYAPVLVFFAVLLVFVVGLQRDRDTLPSPLIGKSVPAFSLPPIQGHALGLSSSDLKGEVALVNVFASWCVACREEHPVLMQLAAQRSVAIHGLNYKDKPDDAAKWLDQMGDPYTRTGADLDGRVAIDWGVYGVPETFVVDKHGRIAFKQVGPITPELLERTILPLISTLRSNAADVSGSDAGIGGHP
jgi:cytochrome c biogenesis protein CcmG/thiol:disulfide interchange protein DsbE